MKSKVLIIDDEVMICKTLKAGLCDMEYSVETAQSKEEALQKVGSFKPSVVLTDMKLGSDNGIALIDDIKKIDNDIEVIVMTAYSDISSAVLAIKKGAFDYINKPFELEEIRIILERALENYKIKNKILILEKQNQCFEETMVGQSEQMKDVFEKIGILSQNDSVTVLILGETGTGKELVADAIHNNSIRREYPILKINCSTIPGHLVESELFGFEKNAFTGAGMKKKGLLEIADGGTVFLDELGEIPLDIQAKLLRFLEERKFRRIGGLEDIEVDIRIITATNKDLERAVKDKAFREDLYYRLNVVPVTVPPLRDRGDDVLLLAEHFLKKYNKAFKKNLKGFEEQAERMLLAYPWPGNIRELKNVIERIVLLTNDERIQQKHLPLEIGKFGQSKEHFDRLRETEAAKEEEERTRSGAGKEDRSLLDNKLDSIEKRYIMKALEKHSGNQTKAADELGISRFALRRKLEKHGL